MLTGILGFAAADRAASTHRIEKALAPGTPGACPPWPQDRYRSPHPGGRDQDGPFAVGVGYGEEVYRLRNIFWVGGGNDELDAHIHDAAASLGKITSCAA